MNLGMLKKLGELVEDDDDGGKQTLYSQQIRKKQDQNSISIAVNSKSYSQCTISYRCKLSREPNGCKMPFQ